MRLTKKYNTNFLGSRYKLEDLVFDDNFPEPFKEKVKTEQINNALYKLGQLEDIEEELGIDLITLFRALKNGAWFRRTKNDIRKFDWFMDFDIELRSKDNDGNNLMNTIELELNYDCEFEYKLSDYGKTWALTKEELE